MFAAFGDSSGYSLHSSLKGTNNITKKTRDQLALFLDKYMLSLLVDIDVASELSSGRKVLVILDENEVTKDMTTLDIQI